MHFETNRTYCDSNGNCHCDNNGYDLQNIRSVI
nr:MAG TPA: Disintegrin and metalloproteinase domain-containing protein [Bacteriophage sp.]